MRQSVQIHLSLPSPCKTLQFQIALFFTLTLGWGMSNALTHCLLHTYEPLCSGEASWPPIEVLGTAERGAAGECVLQAGCWWLR